MGRGLDYSVQATVKPTSRLSISPRFTYSRMNRKVGGDEIFSSRQEIEPLITYKVNPFFIGSSRKG